MNALYLGFGLLFGFLLSRARVTDYDTIIGMFRLRDFYLAGVMGVAIAVAAVGLYLLRRLRASALIGCPIDLQVKAAHRHLPLAGGMFGAGWALTGA